MIKNADQTTDISKL